MNIIQQIAASIGTALFSVILTNGFNDSASVTALRGAAEAGEQPDPAIIPSAYSDMSAAFADVFLVATVLVALCLVPAFFLPRRRPAETSEMSDNAPVLLH